MADGKLLKDHFYNTFVQISAVAWQKMPVFNFLHYKSMETLSCHSNQTKKSIFIKKKKKKKKRKKNFLSPQPKDATDEILAQLTQWLQKRCRLKVLTDDRRQATTTTDHKHIFLPIFYFLSSSTTENKGDHNACRPQTNR